MLEKIYLELIRKEFQQISFVWIQYYQTINRDTKNLFVVGFDYRNYTRIHRNLIWANRIAGSSSFGQNKLIYFMGGVDNWILAKYDYETPIDYEQNYRYQTLATNMRGFKQNIPVTRSIHRIITTETLTSA